MKKQIKKVSAFISLLTLFLVALGGYVRATGAGLACPDWPLCYGRVVPESFDDGVFQEVFHRFIASIVAVLTVYLSILAYRVRKEYPQLWKTCVGLLVLLAVQVVMGGLTVIMQLNPFIVTAHLGLGTIFLLVTALIAIEKEPSPELLQKTTKRGYPRFLLLLTGLVFAQILLGGFVGSSGASLACTDIPLCSGKLFPENATGQQIVHMAHRILAAGILFVLILGILFAERGRKGHLIGMTSIVFIQVLVGLSNVVMLIPTGVTVLHLVLAELILFGTFAVYKKYTPSLLIFSKGS